MTPFEKHKRKDFLRDNDSEYSKLYLSRDYISGVKGTFFINCQNLLENNSSLFSSMKFADDAISDILEQSYFMDIKVYRQRVKRHNPNNLQQEVFLNDSQYEDPPTLVAGISFRFAGDSKPEVYGSMQKINGLFGPVERSRYAFFHFYDPEAANINAGRYQYSVRFKYRDRTYAYLKLLLKDTINIHRNLQRYYDFSMKDFCIVLS